MKKSIKYFLIGCMVGMGMFSVLPEAVFADGMTKEVDYPYSGEYEIVSLGATAEDEVEQIVVDGEVIRLTYEVVDGQIIIKKCSSNVTSLRVPDKIAGKTVVEIGESAFAGCESLTSISFPEGLKCIGFRSFESCKGLRNVSFPKGLTEISGGAFMSCESLTSVNLPDGLTRIGDLAFSGSGLIRVDLPESLTGMGDNVFSGCSSLTSVRIPNSITTIGTMTFFDCDSLTSVTLPEGLTTIGEMAFMRCSSLKDIRLPNSVTLIRNAAFYECYSLAGISLPEKLENLGYSVFGNCSSLRNVRILDRVKRIADDENNIFAGCSNDLTIYGVRGSYTESYANQYEIRFQDLKDWPSNALNPDWKFHDVAVIPGNWKYEAVKYVVEKEIMNGNGVNAFLPDNSLTREMFATMLYRAADQPVAASSNKFSDVVNGKWYSNAVVWANEQGIVSGYGDGTFGVGNFITREQIAKMLMIYGKTQGYDISKRAELNGFADTSQVSPWAGTYMKWAVGSGIISGKPAEGKFFLDPKGDATRAESAVMLMRFMEEQNDGL